VARVGSKRPSETGMFDVHGNVAEWTIEQTWRGGAVGQDQTLCAWSEDASRPPLVGFRFTLAPEDRP
jgi:formylglycine-generating enzyme required for sulfatase activity